MKPSSLFVVGLIVGALSVFAVRAASITGNDGKSAGVEHAPAQEHPADPHAGHDMRPAAAPEPAPAPAPAPAPEPEVGGHAGHDLRPPENHVCPVLGNEVDPEVFVDYEGRRIGFCCPPCIEKFRADPETYLKKVDAEIAARKGGK